MIEVLSHFLGFFIGFTITLGMIGSILHYLRNYSRESLNLLLDLFILCMIITLVIGITIIILHYDIWTIQESGYTWLVGESQECYIEDPGRTGMCRAFKMAYLSDEKLEKVY